MAIDRVGRTVTTVGHQTSRRENHWPLIGSMVLAGLFSAFLGVVALNGFQRPGSGDLVVSSTMASGVTLAIVIVGMLTLLSLELAHLAGRQTRHARRALAATGHRVQCPNTLVRGAELERR